MAIDDHAGQNILENRFHDSLIPETKGCDVRKLNSFGNLSDREITCLVLPTTPTQNKSCVWGRSPDMDITRGL